jgi:hypothetical protein
VEHVLTEQKELVAKTTDMEQKLTGLFEKVSIRFCNIMVYPATPAP